MSDYRDKGRGESVSLSRYPAQLQQRTASLVNTAKRFRKLRALAGHQRGKLADLTRQLSALREAYSELERERDLLIAKLSERDSAKRG